MFADAGNDATQSAADQFAVQSASLTVTKTQTVISDGFGSASPRAIPNAVVEYTITVANGSTTTAAEGLAISDPIPGATTFQTGLYPGPSDVAITGGVGGDLHRRDAGGHERRRVFPQAAATRRSAARRSAASQPARR